MKKTIHLNQVVLTVNLVDEAGKPYYGYEAKILPAGGRTIGDGQPVCENDPTAKFLIAANSTVLEVRFRGKAKSKDNEEGIEVVISRFVRPLACDHNFTAVLPSKKKLAIEEKTSTVTVRVVDATGTLCTDYEIKALEPGGATMASYCVSPGETEGMLCGVKSYDLYDPDKIPLELRILGKLRPFDQGEDGPVVGVSHSFMLEPLTEDLDVTFEIS